MFTLAREKLLSQLEQIQPGLSPRDIIEQSSCFVFQGGRIVTYNDEVSCRCKTSLKITAAVRSEPLLQMLRKLQEDELRAEMRENELVIKGKRKATGITLEREITLPIEAVDKPKDWFAIGEEFSEAINMVAHCAGRDADRPHLLCIHIHPKWIEACDNNQIARYRIKTGVEEPVLVRAESLKPMTGLGMSMMSETKSWLHFKNALGMIYSCRKFFLEKGDYPNLNKFLSVEGSKTTLPKGLVDAADKANIFSSEDADENEVLVEMWPGKLRITGRGASGWHKEWKKVAYDGDPIRFMIAPDLLMDLTKQSNECEINKDFLKIELGRFTYVTALGVEEESKPEVSNGKAKSKKRRAKDNDNDNE